MARTRFQQLVLDHFRQVKLSLFAAGLCTIALAVTLLLVPWPLKVIIDHILLDKPIPSSLGFLRGLIERDEALALILVSASIVMIAVMRGMFAFGQIYITSRIGHQAVYNLRKELFAHLQRLSLSFHNRARSGELMTKIASDTKELKEVFSKSVLEFVTDALTLVGMFGIMVALNWKLSLIPLATFPCLACALFYRFRQTRASARRRRRNEGQLASLMGEVLTAAPLVQAFGREEYEEQRFETESAQSLAENIRTTRLEAAVTRLVEFISAVGTGATVLYGSFQALRGAVTPGDLLLFAMYVGSMYKPVRGLAKITTEFSKASVSAERISEILEIEPEIQDRPDAILAAGLKGEIVFAGVSFDYGDGKAVLRDVSFTVGPGQRVALVGASGAGKSTIVSLILRLYEPQAGAIYIDGVDIRQYQRESLRREITIVPQTLILFGATIQENIAYGKPDATLEEIVAAAKAANAHQFIGELEDGYDTVLGERGCTLSGGQRQRIAIARALVRDSRILILDELTAGLDPENERVVLEALERLAAGRTSFLITHDPLLAARTDLVLYLDDGCVAEKGRPAELLQAGGRFASLYHAQTGADRSPADENPYAYTR